LSIAIAQRRRIEERVNDRRASDDEDEDGENIGGDAPESRPADKGVSDISAADYSTSASSTSATPVSLISGQLKNFPLSDSIHHRRTGRRGDEKSAAEIDVSPSELPCPG
jgi:hypothetical protein